MTRPAIRLAINALEVYSLGLLPEDQQIANDTIKEFQRVILSANRRRAAARKANEQRTSKEKGM